MNRNIELIRWHELLAHFMPWLPIFVLFTRGSFGLDGALVIGAVHYFTVVIGEVPSGWFSDRVGRVATLRLTAVLTAIAHAGFLASDGRFALVVGSQALLALAFASLSGTNVALHYDSLEAIGRETEFEQRQSSVAAISYSSAAVSALAGGALALIEIRLAFAAALIAALAQLAITLRLEEPPRHIATPLLHRQLADCVAYLRRPILRWVLGYWIAMVVLEHLAFELSQPYITAALDNTADRVEETPIVAGILFAGFGVVGALAARAAPRLRKSLGFFGVLLLVAATSAVVITTMAAVVHLAVLAVLLMRSVQGAAASVVLTSSVSPMIAQPHRATYFSLHSLAGRAVHGGVLLLAARTVGDDLPGLLSLFTGIAWLLVIAVVVAWASVAESDRVHVAEA